MQARSARAGKDDGLCDRQVLVVEDEMLVCMMIEDMLAEFGCHVVGPATNVKQALALAADATIDVAILDVNLNGERSFAVVDTLRKRNIPVLFATGYGAEGLGDAHGNAPVLKKPFHERELRNALGNALRSRSVA